MARPKGILHTACAIAMDIMECTIWTGTCTVLMGVPHTAFQVPIKPDNDLLRCNGGRHRFTVNCQGSNVNISMGGETQ